jgi:hypothetical protein
MFLLCSRGLIHGSVTQLWLPKFHFCVLKGQPLGPILCQLNPVHILKRRFLTILTPTTSDLSDRNAICIFRHIRASIVRAKETVSEALCKML